MYWTNVAEGKASIEKARMNGARDQIKQVYVKDSKDVKLGALIVDPSGDYIYFVEKKNKKFVRLSLKGMYISFDILQPNTVGTGVGWPISYRRAALILLFWQRMLFN